MTPAPGGAPDLPNRVALGDHSGAHGPAGPNRSLPPISPKLLAAALFVALGSGAVLAKSRWTFDELSHGLDADIAALRRYRWEPPPLRQAGETGNAAEAIHAELAQAQALQDAEREALAKVVVYGNPPEAASLALLKARSAELARLRGETRRSFAMTLLDVERGDGMQGPDQARVMDAALLMLAHAEVEGGGEALELAIDSIRFGQVLVPGAPLESASVAMRIAALAARVVGRHATRASHAELVDATRQLYTLAKHPAPTGIGLELHDIRAAAQLRAASARQSGVPWAVVRERKRLFEAWAVYDEPTRWRNLVASDYPDALAAWRSESERRASSDLPHVSEGSRGVTGFLYDDMRGQALVRALAVGVATLADRARTGKLPREPATLKDSTLCDPFSGGPLNWRVTQDGDDLAVWSVGENLRDDLGTDEWTGQAPLDVTVHLTLSPLEGADAPRAGDRPRRHRRR